MGAVLFSCCIIVSEEKHTFHFVPLNSSLRQNLTLTPEPETCFFKQIRSNEQIIKYIICKNYKNKFLIELDRYGVNWGLIYPDLDGLSKRVNWQVECGSKMFPQSNTA